MLLSAGFRLREYELLLQPHAGVEVRRGEVVGGSVLPAPVELESAAPLPSSSSSNPYVIITFVSDRRSGDCKGIKSRAVDRVAILASASSAAFLSSISSRTRRHSWAQLAESQVQSSFLHGFGVGFFLVALRFFALVLKARATRAITGAG